MEDDHPEPELEAPDDWPEPVDELEPEDEPDHPELEPELDPEDVPAGVEAGRDELDQPELDPELEPDDVLRPPLENELLLRLPPEELLAEASKAGANVSIKAATSAIRRAVMGNTLLSSTNLIFPQPLNNHPLRRKQRLPFRPVEPARTRQLVHFQGHGSHYHTDEGTHQSLVVLFIG